MEVNDRGTKKWTAMMMPEQIKLLNDYWETTEYKQNPVLDEQELDEINMKLQLAIRNDLTVEIKYFANHDFETVEGKLKKVDAANKYIQLDDEDWTSIKLMDVIDVNIK